MSEAKFTPGPWSYDGKFTVGIPHRDGETFFRTNPEDARLIVVSPDLYEALDEAINYLAAWASSYGDEKAAALLNKSTAALAKARGE